MEVWSEPGARVESKVRHLHPTEWADQIAEMSTFVALLDALSDKQIAARIGRNVDAVRGKRRAVDRSRGRVE